MKNIIVNSNNEECNIKYRKSRSEEYSVQLTPDPVGGLGILMGMKNEETHPFVLAFKKDDNKKLLPAERSGKIFLGDALVSVNNLSVEEMQLDEVLVTIKKSLSCHSTITLIFRKDEITRKTIQNAINNVMKNSVSSDPMTMKQCRPAEDSLCNQNKKGSIKDAQNTVSKSSDESLSDHTECMHSCRTENKQPRSDASLLSYNKQNMTVVKKKQPKSVGSLSSYDKKSPILCSDNKKQLKTHKEISTGTSSVPHTRDALASMVGENSASSEKETNMDLAGEAEIELFSMIKRNIHESKMKSSKKNIANASTRNNNINVVEISEKKNKDSKDKCNTCCDVPVKSVNRKETNTSLETGKGKEANTIQSKQYCAVGNEINIISCHTTEESERKGKEVNNCQDKQSDKSIVSSITEMNIKYLHQIGDKVKARCKQTSKMWCDGIVKGFLSQPAKDTRYGEIRRYKVEFKQGTIFEVLEYNVIPLKDVEISETQLESLGIYHCCDKQSTDKYAKMRGWYEYKGKCFRSSSDALEEAQLM